MPAGASSRSEVVAWGGRSFGVSKTTTDGHAVVDERGREGHVRRRERGDGERKRAREEPDDDPARVTDP